MSLRLRLLLALAPLFILGLAAADVGTYAALQSSLLQGVDQQLVGDPTRRAERAPDTPRRPGSAGATAAADRPAGSRSLPGPTARSSTGRRWSRGGATSLRWRPSHRVVIAPGASRRRSPATPAQRSRSPGTGTCQSYRVLRDTGRGRAASESLVVAAIPLDGVEQHTEHAAALRDRHQQRHHDHRAGRHVAARAPRDATARAHGRHGTVDRRGRPRQARLAVERAHRGRPSGPRAQRHARPDRAGLRGTRCHRAEVCAISSPTPRTSCARR